MKLLLLCFAVLCIAYVDCKGGGRGGGGRGGGGRGGGGGSGSIFKGIFGSGKSPSGSHTYPASTGYSGQGSGGSHGYPSSNGLSGRGNQRQGAKYGQGYGTHGWNVPRVPSYYTAPQYVYVNQYRSSGSRFNNLLIGLTMYNMGRSHVYHHHYYHDSYYRRSSTSSVSNDTGTLDNSISADAAEDNDSKKKDEATCILRVVESENEKVLKIPCAIVTTFIDGKRKVPDESNVTSTMCVNFTETQLINSTSLESMVNNDTNSSGDNNICQSTVNAIDPLSVTGSPLNTNGIECKVEIWTSQEVISNEVDCETLLQYAKMPVPENKDTIIMPPRSELKRMLEYPPWWLSLFLAV